MKITIFCRILFLGKILTACKQVGDPVSVNSPNGTYAYFGYDSLMNSIVNGWIKIELEDSTKITGRWHFEETGNPGNIGPQDGKGDLIGGVTDTSIWIDLYSNYADNNILLMGKYDSKYIYGEWQWVTFIGITNWGTFKAELKE